MISNTSIEKDIETLTSFITKYQHIVDGLNSNSAWESVLEDKKEIANGLDRSWAYESDKDKLFKMQVTKIATDDILNMVDRYKEQIRILSEERAKLINPENTIQKDVDNG